MTLANKTHNAFRARVSGHGGAPRCTHHAPRRACRPTWASFRLFSVPTQPSCHDRRVWVCTLEKPPLTPSHAKPAPYSPDGLHRLPGVGGFRPTLHHIRGGAHRPLRFGHGRKYHLAELVPHYRVARIRDDRGDRPVQLLYGDPGLGYDRDPVYVRHLLQRQHVG